MTLTTTNLAQLIIGTLGGLLVTSEYSSGLNRLSLAVVSTRLPVLWAKVVVLAGVSVLFLALSIIAIFVDSQAMLGAGDSPTDSLGDAGVLRALLGTAAYLTGIGVLGAALGTIIRATRSLDQLFGGVFLLPALIGILCPPAWGEVTKCLPSNAGVAVIRLPNRRGGCVGR